MKASLFNVVVAIAITSCVGQTLMTPSKLAGRTIAIQPLTGYTDTSAESLTLKRSLTDRYHANVIVLKPVSIPNSYRSFLGVDTAYNADSLLASISSKIDSKETIVVGLTKDLLYVKKPILFKQLPANFPRPIDTVFDSPVLGLSYLGGHASVISTFRATTNDTNLFAKRIEKIITHEFGHIYGLQHCPDEKCIMSDKNSDIPYLDNSSGNYCRQCSKRL